MFKAPETITILSDGNTLKFKEILKPQPKGELHYIYQYENSLTKKGNLLGLTEKELEKLISNNKIK